jgi:hypothetical protein
MSYNDYDDTDDRKEDYDDEYGGDRYGDDDYDEEKTFDYDDEDGDGLDSYRSPSGDDYGEPEEIPEFKEVTDSYIDTGAEWRDFADGGASKSRVGMARRVDIVDEDLGTFIFDDKYKKLEKISRTPEDIYRVMTLDTVKKYNLPNELVSDSLRIMQYIKQYNKVLKFKSPKLVVLALTVIKENKLDIYSLNKIIEKVSDEGITKMDIIRYVTFIQGLRNYGK